VKVSTIRDPLVSVVMPAWNAARTVERAALSILDQTYSHLELIAVDDASTDDTAGLLARIRDPRLRILRLPQRVGGAAARNAGIRAAAGELIAAMDADDVSDPRRIEQEVRFLRERPDVGIVFCAFDCVDESGRVLDRVYPPAEDAEIRGILIRQNPFAHSTLLARRTVLEAVGLYREWCRKAQDYDLYLRVAQHWKLGCVSQVLHRVLVHSESVTQRGENQVCAFDLLARLTALYRGQYPLRSLVFFGRTFASMLVPASLKRWLRGARGHRYRYFQRDLLAVRGIEEATGAVAPGATAAAAESAGKCPGAGSFWRGARLLRLGLPALPGSAPTVSARLLVLEGHCAACESEGVPLRQDQRALPFRTASLDFACADVDPAEVDDCRAPSCLRELRRVLKPGASLCLRIGRPASVESGSGWFANRLFASSLTTWRKNSELRAQLRAAGFAVQACYAVFPFVSAPRYVLDARDWRTLSYLLGRLPIGLERGAIGAGFSRLLLSLVARLFDQRVDIPAPGFALLAVLQ